MGKLRDQWGGNEKKEGNHFELGFYHEISAALSESSNIDGQNRNCRDFLRNPDRTAVYGSTEFKDSGPEAGGPGIYRNQSEYTFTDPTVLYLLRASEDRDPYKCDGLRNRRYCFPRWQLYDRSVPKRNGSGRGCVA